MILHVNENETSGQYYLFYIDKSYYYLYKDVDLKNLQPVDLTVVDKSKFASIEVLESAQSTSLASNAELCQVKSIQVSQQTLNYQGVSH